MKKIIISKVLHGLSTSEREREEKKGKKWPFEAKIEIEKGRIGLMETIYRGNIGIKPDDVGRKI